MDDIIYEYYQMYDEIFRSILRDMVDRSNKPIRLRKINPSMYQKALNDFMKFGKITNYPTKYIEVWKNIIITNYTYLDVITMFFGHKDYFDVDMFNDEVLRSDETGDKVSDWTEAMEYIEKNGYDQVLDNILPRFSNGQDLISDYGLKPLGEIVVELLQTNDHNKIIVLINKALDISHQRSDLSELFIDGGYESLNRISGLNENLRRIIREQLLKYMK